LLNGVKGDEGRIDAVFAQALSRSPNSTEQAILKSLIASQRQRYARAPDAAKEVVSVGQRPITEGVDVVELASLLSVTRAVFNMHEFITRN
jgi:hypothetical protein